jgi:hypothetical protein
LLPTAWFRNTWSFGYDAGPMGDVPGRPVLKRIDGVSGDTTVHLSHPAAGDYYLYADRLDETSHPQLLFTDNETNPQRLSGRPNGSAYVKDAFHRHVVDGEPGVVNPAGEGTKVAAWYSCLIPSQGSCTLRLRIAAIAIDKPFDDFALHFNRSVAEAGAFYAAVQRDVGPEQQAIQRQALAGMIWTKQFFITMWSKGCMAIRRRRICRHRERADGTTSGNI